MIITNKKCSCKKIMKILKCNKLKNKSFKIQFILRVRKNK